MIKSIIAWFAFLTFVLTSERLYADTLTNPIQFSGYIETYYGYDFSNPDELSRPDFLYSYHRHNEVNLNLGYIKTAYLKDGVRGNFALMTGTYAAANLAGEPALARSIFEANAGVKVSRKMELWIDAGVFASHIGFESAVGANCWTMTRSILADNSPYYESGVKLSYTSASGKWFLSALVLNGWQRIYRLSGSEMPSFGHQITWTPNKKVVLNSSSYIGREDPLGSKSMRYFHNFFGQFQLSEQLGLIAGFDIGAQQQAKGSEVYEVWYSPVLIARYTPTERFALAARAEYYSDEDRVIIASPGNYGFQTLGYSFNTDLRVRENVLWRVEFRSFKSHMGEIFRDAKGNSTRLNHYLGTSLSIGF
jgi:hypothetical protein